MAESAEPDPYPRRRDTVAAFLSGRSTVLGDLYRHASAMLEDRRPEGWQHLVAHVARELLSDLLRPALQNGDLRDRAVELVHRFGEQGYLTLRGLLD